MKSRLSILAAGILLASCSSQVEIRPAVKPPPDLRFGRTVGLHISQALRTKTYAADPYRNRHTANFPVGAASAGMFERLLPALFERVVPLKTHPPDASLKEQVEAVFEPAMTGFRFVTVRVGQYRYWARVRYRINLFEPNGALRTSWPVTGWGEATGYDADIWGKAATEALEDAGRRFARSLADYPEARRQTADAPPAEPAIQPSLEDARAPELDEYATRARLPGTVTIVANGRPDAKGAADKEGTINAGHLIAVELRIKNEGPHPLLIERATIGLSAIGGRTWSNVPASLMAAWLTQRYGRVVVMGPGPVGAVLGLVTGLASGTAAMSETDEYDNRLPALRSQAFEDARLAPGESASGLLFFSISPADRALQRMALTGSVIDLESATRRELRLPVILPPYVPPKPKPDAPEKDKE